MNNNKSPRIDQIINEFLKNMSDNVLKLTVNVLDDVLGICKVPDDWYMGVICPIYKNNGLIDNLNNYRGITLLSSMGKLFTS